ncbi:MAG: hypothetical protein ACE5LA_07970, partial [Dehalococcoidales bacterium]
YITDHEVEVAQMMVEKNYTVGDPKVHAYLLKQYDYSNPSVQGVKDVLRFYGAIYQYVGIIESTTDIDALVEKHFVQLIPEVGKSSVPPPPRRP